MSWVSKLKNGLKKTASLFSFQGSDSAAREQLEEALIQADVGVKTTALIMQALERKKPADAAAARQVVADILLQKIEPAARPMPVGGARPFVVLAIGVNGSGKTTTLGKLGHFYTEQGLRVAFVAADTFRAGATEQLQRWGEKIKAPVHASAGGDAAALVYDALQKSKKAGDDLLLIDTAGRLHNRTDLMDELKKIKRVIRKVDPEAPHATVLVLDATVGQNALAQVKTFQEAVGLSGLVMTKLDGTAKGGILVALADAFGLPIYAVGVGEDASDLQPFQARAYVDSLLGDA